MSFLDSLTSISTWIQKYLPSSNVSKDTTAVLATIKLLNDIAASKETLSEVTNTGVTLAEAIATIVPGAQDAVICLELVQALAAVYEAIPNKMPLFKVEHGQVPPLWGDTDLINHDHPPFI